MKKASASEWYERYLLAYELAQRLEGSGGLADSVMRVREVKERCKEKCKDALWFELLDEVEESRRSG